MLYPITMLAIGDAMNARKTHHNMKPSDGGKLRIIGGKWRGRQLQFPAVEGLRPTGDRIRETVFNWLTGHVADAQCLDVFSGSGAMAFEALSRGAKYVTALELNTGAANTLKKHALNLACNEIEIINTNSLQWLQKNTHGKQYDIVFIDPPFAAELVGICVSLLIDHEWLSPNAWIYIEADSKLPDPILPDNVVTHRCKQAGQVNYGLYYLS